MDWQHYNFRLLEIYHYNSTNSNHTITIVRYSDQRHVIRPAMSWGHLQRISCLCICVWTPMPLGHLDKVPPYPTQVDCSLPPHALSPLTHPHPDDGGEQDGGDPVFGGIDCDDQKHPACVRAAMHPIARNG